MKATCKTKCYWRERLWKPGDTVVISEDEADSLPRHFDVPGRLPVQAEPPRKEPSGDGGKDKKGKDKAGAKDDKPSGDGGEGQDNGGNPQP